MLLVSVVLVAALAFGTAMARKQHGLPSIGRPTRRDIAGIVLFVGGLGGQIYGIENTDRVNSGGWQRIAGVLLLVGYVGGGLVVGKGGATLPLPLLASV